MTKRKAEKLAKAKAELAEVEKAISGIVGGSQSYGIGSRSVHKANLETLYKRKALLEETVDALSGTGLGRFRRVITVDR